MRAFRIALFPALACAGVTCLCAAEQDDREYHWGRDARYFDEIHSCKQFTTELRDLPAEQ